MAEQERKPEDGDDGDSRLIVGEDTDGPRLEDGGLGHQARGIGYLPIKGEIVVNRAIHGPKLPEHRPN